MQNDSQKSKAQLLEELKELRRRAMEPEGVSLAGEELSQFKMALRCGRAGCYDIDVASFTAVWSPELEEIYGMQPGTFSGRYEDWQACVLPDDLDDAIAGMQKMIYTDDGMDTPFRIRRRDTGEVRWLEARGRS